MTSTVGRKPGTPKTGGRQKGSLNKATKAAIELAEELEVNPFEILLLYCKRDWEALGFKSGEVIKTRKDGSQEYEYTITADMQLIAAKEACQYLMPKRKAVEHSGEINVGTLTDEELIGILKAFNQGIKK